MRTSKRLSDYNSVVPDPQPLQLGRNIHPLKQRYEPVLLDRYPSQSDAQEVKRRELFPEYVPMFAFPNDINVVSSDERPKSTWHGFAMTTANNSKLYGVCLTIWMPLGDHAAAELERRCEEWRQKNITNEERELATSLSERLVQERAKLSRLLAELPLAFSGSEERNFLEDEISQVEEKISLMNELLRPLRHGAASRIDGLASGSSELWVPRAYGVLGRDGGMTSFWKDWLRAVVIPMTNGAIQRVPPTSPKVGSWLPLERYVVNLCTEASTPASSLTQTELNIRELRLYARKEAANELPGSRNTDLYALFRCLSLQNIVTLFEHALFESRIIFVSSHTAMLHLASSALIHLLYPLKWAGIFIPVLPARLVQALGAPCPYIVGIEKRYESVEYPEDDFVLVDLDRDIIESTARTVPLPRQQRRKLLATLQLAAPLHHRHGIPTGPPPYAIESFPFNFFAVENDFLLSQRARVSSLARLVGESSAAFGDASMDAPPSPPIFNAFSASRAVKSSHVGEKASTSSSVSTRLLASSESSTSSATISFAPVTRAAGATNGTTNTLREKRSGQLDAASKRSSSVYNLSSYTTQRRVRVKTNLPKLGLDRSVSHRPSAQSQTRASSTSTPTLCVAPSATSLHAPSVYAASTLATSTVVPCGPHEHGQTTDSMRLVEGHCFQSRLPEFRVVCSLCDEKVDEAGLRCSGKTLNWTEARSLAKR